MLVAPAIKPQSPPSANTGAASALDGRAARCSDLAAKGPEFGPLASACIFALSPQSLPNYVCRESIQRFTNDHYVDVLSAEVTFVYGWGDQYSNYAENGKPITSWANASPGWFSKALFGTQLTAIFQPVTRTKFKLNRSADVLSGSRAAFDFHFDWPNNFNFRSGNFRPSLSGTIWVDKASGEIRRVETTQTDRPHEIPTVSYSSSVDYGDVAIPDVGNVLVPMTAEMRACMSDGNCYHNLISFGDCRKFASTARMVPGLETEP
jgi:hypothetical protein